MAKATAVATDELFGKALSETEATELTAKIQALSVEYATLIYRAYAGQVWIPLGVESWEKWCEAHLLVKVSRPTVAGRVALVKALKDKGMGQRAIASALGVNQSQVSRAIKEDSVPESGNGAEATERTPKTVDERLESAINTLAKLLVKHGPEIQESQAAMDALAALRSKIQTALPASK